MAPLIGHVIDQHRLSIANQDQMDSAALQIVFVAFIDYRFPAGGNGQICT